ncbi:hypothetical protein [Paenibacillus tepidiphilus]|uniref:hypothetical protein n=1 Tax=Paenibacillus tepidiphilus TaxID=2608683 RepID=UPI00123C391A|nr:hypothetical protein [Paenibacillus tepidiphilus]
MSKYISQKEMANLFGKSVNTIRLWVDKGMITAINADTYRSDGGYRFSQEEYERVKRLFGTDVLFLKDAAELVGVTKQYLAMLAKADPPEIPSQLIMYGRQERRVFRKADCLMLKEALKAKNTHQMRDGGRELQLYNNDLRLFDNFRYNEQLVIVISVEPVKLLSENGYTIEPNDGSLPVSNKCLNFPYEKRAGSIIFSFPKPESITSEIYHLLERMVFYLGTKNVRVFDRESTYYVKTRKGEFKGTLSDVELLNKYKLEGQLSFHGEMVYLDGETITRRSHLKKTVVKSVEKYAENHNMNFDQALNELLRKALQSDRSNKFDEE